MSHDRRSGFSELTFQSAILDSLSAHIAVLDSTGMIVAVNLSWQTFADENGLGDENAGIGSNYLDVCRTSEPDPTARQAHDGIRGVIDGRLPSFYLRYACHAPSQVRWFALRASPLRDHPSFVVVSHENITEQVLARISRRMSR